LYGKRCRLLFIPFHPFLQIGEWFEIFCFFIKLPFFLKPAIVGHYRIPGIDASMFVEKAELTAVRLILAVNIVSKRKNIILSVLVLWYARRY